MMDVKDYESQSYEIDDKTDRIGYKDQDRIAFNKVFGYKTVFLYFHLFEKGKIKKKESLLQNMNINIKCGSFSFAEIPKKFDFIMGVTGTLKTLNDYEEDVIKNDYKIIKKTYMPSVFGDSKFSFSKTSDIFIEKKTLNSESFYMKIIDDINHRMEKRGPKRAVLVFFESKKHLDEFYNSDKFKSCPLKENALILSELTENSEKDALVRKATLSGRLTLITKSFGRGTDFKCKDPIVINNDGVHVIQTFLSEELSEEIQIKGRTARQGDEGSYEMILLETDLEKYLIRPEEIIANQDQIYDNLLNKKRNEFFKSKYETNKKFIVESTRRHSLAQEFIKIFMKEEKVRADIFADENKFKEILKYLVEFNKGPDIPISKVSISRTCCVMDATGSMGGLIQKTKATVCKMCERIVEILKSKNIDPSCFQMQFCIYRNWGEKERDILQHSGWESRSDVLLNFMNTCNASGGDGPGEAVEVGLFHANQQNDLSQVILIGDCQSNTPSETINHRKGHGENYWKTTKFASSFDYKTEVNKLKSNKIPVHAFYVYNGSGVKANFEEIARDTGGQCKYLDINSSKGADMLTEIIALEVLKNAGNQNGGVGNILVDEYKKKYGCTFT